MLAAILLVDDEALVRPALARVLRRAGHTVVEAGSGEEALAIVEDAAMRIDLLVTDLRMPRLDGRELARRARQLRPGLAVLLMSGADDRPPGARDPDPLLLKPFGREDLLAAVAETLNRGS